MTPLARDEALVLDSLYGGAPTEDAESALARIVGQARAAEELQRELDEAKSISFARETKAAVWKGRAERYEKALREWVRRLETVGMEPPKIAYDALAAAGVTDNERTARTEVWITERTYRDPEGGRTAGTGPTAAEHAQSLHDRLTKRAQVCRLVGLTEWSSLSSRVQQALDGIAAELDEAAALVALAERQALALDCLSRMRDDRDNLLNYAGMAQFARRVLAGGAGDE